MPLRPPYLLLSIRIVPVMTRAGPADRRVAASSVCGGSGFVVWSLRILAGGDVPGAHGVAVIGVVLLLRVCGDLDGVDAELLELADLARCPLLEKLRRVHG